jgi:predicted aldo/keto reductase-like oxidoreductase
MQYRKDKYGNDISALGYGCMRFTKKGNSADLDKSLFHYFLISFRICGNWNCLEISGQS